MVLDYVLFIARAQKTRLKAGFVQLTREGRGDARTALLFTFEGHATVAELECVAFVLLSVHKDKA